ncbi:MAG: glycosyltransferase family 2 protein [Oscillospiraceae bacterium]|nr:glycosyltransferase family 2 protein [Oscillospiraceae bacterium]
MISDEKDMAEKKVQQLSAELNSVRNRMISAETSFAMVQNSIIWKMTLPLRKFLDFLKAVADRVTPLRYVKKFLGTVKNSGFRAAWEKTRKKLSADNDNGNKEIINSFSLSASEIKMQKNTRFDRNIKFSIIVPLYNTPVKFLKEMLQSVIAQTYENWELCLADGSDSEHPEVGATVLKFAGKDSRIKYKKLEKNLGISDNSNACIDMAEGDYIGLFDHDDLLHPAALFEVMKAICEKDADYVYTDEMVFRSPNINDVMHLYFKSDYGPDTLRGINYICHFSVFSRELLDKTYRFRHEYDGSQDHDLILRLTSIAKKIVHIPKILYFWRSHPNSVASDISAKTYAIEAGRNAVRDHIASLGMKAKVLSTEICPTAYRIKYEIKTYDKVSIIIPNKNHLDDLTCCINSILSKSTYPDYEIVIVDNGSDDKELFRYYEKLKRDKRFVICSLDIPFNYSTLNNFAVRKASGKYYILLNNDIEIITPEWIEEMLMYVQRDDVGICGAKLYYPDDTIQHAGVIIGIGGIAGHCFGSWPKDASGYLDRLIYSQDLSAVTAACLMIKASVFNEIGGLDEENFSVAFNDVDLCLKVRQAGYLVVWTPYAEAYHYESKSRGYEDTPEKIKRFQGEIDRFKKKWADVLEEGDPYYNPNLTLERGDFSLK